MVFNEFIPKVVIRGISVFFFRVGVMVVHYKKRVMIMI